MLLERAWRKRLESKLRELGPGEAVDVHQWQHKQGNDFRAVEHLHPDRCPFVREHSQTGEAQGHAEEPESDEAFETEPFSHLFEPKNDEDLEHHADANDRPDQAFGILHDVFKVDRKERVVGGRTCIGGDERNAHPPGFRAEDHLRGAD